MSWLNHHGKDHDDHDENEQTPKKSGNQFNNQDQLMNGIPSANSNLATPTDYSKDANSDGGPSKDINDLAKGANSQLPKSGLNKANEAAGNQLNNIAKPLEKAGEGIKKAADDDQTNSGIAPGVDDLNRMLDQSHNQAMNALNNPDKTDIKPGQKKHNRPLNDPDNDADKQNKNHGKPEKDIADQLGGLNGLKALPARLKKGAAKAKNAVASSITKTASAAGVTLSVKTASVLASTFLIGAPVAGVTGVVALTKGPATTLYNDNDSCATQNTGDENYEDAGDIAGQASGWNQENMKKIWNFFKKKGFSGIAIAGIMGNMAQESGFNPEASSGPDIGIIQWTDNGESQAKTKLIQWCNAHHKNYKELGPQLDYLWEASSSAATANGVRSNATLVHQLEDASSVRDAVDIWFKQIEGAGIAAMDKRYAYGQQIYSQMHGSSVKGNKAKLNSLLGSDATEDAISNAATAEQANNINCGTEDANDADTSNIVSTAKSLEGYFTYAQSRPVSRNVTKNHGTNDDIKPHDLSNIDKHGTTDCTGFVWLTLKLAGYNVPADGDSTYGWFGGHFDQCAHQIDSKDAKAGDILITPAHASILMEDWHGPDTQIMNEGGSNNGPVHQESAAYAYGQYLVDEHFYRAKK